MACRAVFAHFSRREMMSSGWDKPQSLKVSSRFCSLLGSALRWVSPLSTQHSILERGRQYNEERRGRIIFHFQSYFPPDSTAPTTVCSKSISSPGVCLYDQKWYPSTLCYWVLNSTRRNVHVCTVYVYCSSTVSIICCQTVLNCTALLYMQWRTVIEECNYNKCTHSIVVSTVLIYSTVRSTVLTVTGKIQRISIT